MGLDDVGFGGDGVLVLWVAEVAVGFWGAHLGLWVSGSGGGGEEGWCTGASAAMPSNRFRRVSVFVLTRAAEIS